MHSCQNILCWNGLVSKQLHAQVSCCGLPYVWTVSLFPAAFQLSFAVLFCLICSWLRVIDYADNTQLLICHHSIPLPHQSSATCVVKLVTDCLLCVLSARCRADQETTTPRFGDWVCNTRWLACASDKRKVDTPGEWPYLPYWVQPAESSHERRCMLCSLVAWFVYSLLFVLLYSCIIEATKKAVA